MAKILCTECLDQGYRIWDGEARACPCETGRQWEADRLRNLRGSGLAGNSEGRGLLPPGGDVLLSQARREAIGAPIGALEQGLPVRGVVDSSALAEASLAVDEARALAQQLSSALAGALHDLSEGVPPSTVVDRFTPAITGLPEWATPAVLRRGSGRTRKATTTAAPLAP